MTTTFNKLYLLALLIMTSANSVIAQSAVPAPTPTALIRVQCSHGGHSVQRQEIVKQTMDHESGQLRFRLPRVNGPDGVFPDGSELWLTLSFLVDGDLYVPYFIADLAEPSGRIHIAELMNDQGKGLVVRRDALFRIDSTIFDGSMGDGLICYITFKVR